VRPYLVRAAGCRHSLFGAELVANLVASRIAGIRQALRVNWLHQQGLLPWEWWGFPSDLGGVSLNTRIHVYLRVFTLIRVF
jgi:hypothetical protein